MGGSLNFPGARGRGCRVATAAGSATEAALSILARGGNAVDAAAAAAWALSVCEPSGSGIGGQTTMLVRLADGRVRIIDGHSRAPRKVSIQTVSRQEQTRGYKATTIPSTPATLDYLVARYGRLTTADALRPAIQIAGSGYELTRLQRRQTRWTAGLLSANLAASRLFLPCGALPARGGTIRNPELAETLSRLATDGVTDFYHGRMAREIANDMRRHGGLLDEKDLASVHAPVERDPLAIKVGKWRAFLAPPPGGGLQMALALRITHSLALMGCSDPWLRNALAVYWAFWARERHSVGSEVDWCSAISEERAESLARNALNTRIEPAPGAKDGPGDTTHVTVSDGEGNIVCLTQSIQSLFGAKVAHGGLGFLYNNYLCTCPRSDIHAYGLAGGSQPRSNVSPCLVMEGKRPVLALGAAGSRRIVSSVALVSDLVLREGFDIQRAVDEPRIHALLSGKVWIEMNAAEPGRLEQLRHYFSKIVMKPEHAYDMGCVQALSWSADDAVSGAADPRRGGTVGQFEIEGGR